MSYVSSDFTQTPKILENVLYLEAKPINPLKLSCKIGKDKQELETNQKISVYCMDQSHKYVLPLTLCLRNGVKMATVRSVDQKIKIPSEVILKYTTGETVVHSNKYKRSNQTKNISQRFQEPEPETKEFVGVIELDMWNGSLDVTHLETLPKYLFNTTQTKVIKTQRTITHNPIIRTQRHFIPNLFVRDPFIQIGNRVYGRVENLELYNLTGNLDLYIIMRSQNPGRRIGDNIPRV